MTTNQEEQKQYNQYVTKVTPTHNIWMNMFRAFWTGGAVCVFGQWIQSRLMAAGIEKESAGIWMLIILVGTSALLTLFHLFSKLTKYAGAGVLVPITGFANSVAAPAAEYAPEGEVFGKGVQIFSIAGPVILYGVIASWLLGAVYWILQII